MYSPYVVIDPVSNLEILDPVSYKVLEIPLGPTSSITPLSKTLEIV